MDAPRTDIWEIEDGKIKTFDCYPEGTIISAQFGVLANFQAALAPVGGAQDNDLHEPGIRASPAAARG
jgi:hypothetical protein